MHIAWLCFEGSLLSNSETRRIICQQFAMARAASRSFREAPPSSYILKIEKFSLLVKHQIKFLESLAFEAAGAKWKLVLYPTGKENEGGKDHVSLYLAIADFSSLLNNWEFKLEVKLFVYSSRNKKYLMVQDHFIFNAYKPERGIAKLISHATFYGARNGYLVDDCCKFGVEITGDHPPAKSECFSLIEKPPNNKVTWKMMKFSKFNEYSTYKSDEFIIGQRRWRIDVRPSGFMTGLGESLSVFLSTDGFTNNAPEARSFVKFKLRVLNQLDRKHCEKETSYWFPADMTGNGFGFWEFMPLKDLQDPSKGFLVNDQLYVGVEIDVISLTKCL